MNILHKKAFPFDELVRFIGLKKYQKRAASDTGMRQ